jgi:hypothetical protein
MDQHQCAQFVRDREEPVQTRVGQFNAADLCADLHAEESGPTHAPTHLVNRPVGFLQRHGTQRGEAGGVSMGDPGEELVLCGREFRCSRRRRFVAERHRNRRKHLHRNTIPIHVGHSGIG